MAFIGKLVYLALFPGLLFIVCAGALARGVLSSMSEVLTGITPAGPARSVPDMFRLMGDGMAATWGSLQAVAWLAPCVKIFALSWISCMIFGVVGGDLIGVFALLLLAVSADLVLCFASPNARARQRAWREAATTVGWAVPLALVLCGISLRTGMVSVAGLIQWQVINGIVIGSAAGGASAQAGTALLLPAALACGIAFMGLRPLGGGELSGPDGGLAPDLYGPPLALLRMGETACLFVFPLLVISLFFAGPASNWYEVVFWTLKVAGVFLLLAVIDLVSPRARAVRSMEWLLLGAGALALPGLILVWVGVSA